jgi:hypothetical protein
VGLGARGGGAEARPSARDKDDFIFESHVNS